jgi:hypothetical protein
VLRGDRERTERETSEREGRRTVEGDFGPVPINCAIMGAASGLEGMLLGAPTMLSRTTICKTPSGALSAIFVLQSHGTDSPSIWGRFGALRGVEGRRSCGAVGRDQLSS